MSGISNITVEQRTEKGKGARSMMRAAGYVPGVVYGPGMKETIAVKVKSSVIAPFANSAHKETTRLSVELPDGKKELCLMREVQRDCISGKILHVDFMQLMSDRKIMVNVPVELVGREACVGLKQGGVIDQLLHDIEMDVLPGEIPDAIVIDVTNLELEKSIHVRDLTFPASAELKMHTDEIVVTVITPRAAIEEAAELSEEEPKEVEVLAKGKAKSGEEEE